MRIANEVKANPITPPARKAVLKHSVHPGFWAAMVVRTLAKTATFIPIQPESMEVKAPRRKATVVKAPWMSPSVVEFPGTRVEPHDTKAKMMQAKMIENQTQIRYSACKNASAPVEIAPEMSFRRLVTSLSPPA